ncbi:hypothetical protein [Micromonospora sp. WMMD812]|uniref:hypothetical protein n=1 Tax=Micromonospora sp. WMMD812 TaxID=3015152 RepID=UPI00248A9301|nr:hypothetical protein [Micromonospora sp. WMMD812]WBB70786.1 hypothetical protein O7603_16110 [Micromonospora sp. WMMD812]
MPEVEVAELTHIGRLDRRRDLAGWLFTPLVTLLAAPVIAGCVGMVVVLGADKPPALCASSSTDNRCEETTLAMWGEHAALFAAAWLLLWLVPWWRGLRVPRVLLAIIATAVVVAVPIRMSG